MKNKTCCFSGHRKLQSVKKYELVSKLEKVIIELAESGFLYFETGGALGFDTLVAQTVLRLKKDYPQIKLVLVLPCESQSIKWKNEDREIYERIKSRADKVIYTSKYYFRGCMHKRNRYLVDSSSVCVCFLSESTGGTFYTVNYAMKNGIKVINIDI